MSAAPPRFVSDRVRLGDYGLPRLVAVGEIMVESVNHPGGNIMGYGETGMPAVAPVLASGRIEGAA